MSRDLTLEPVLLQIASGKNGFATPVPRPLLKVLKVQGVNMRDPGDKSQINYAYRMFVTDGRLTMHACLAPKLHFYIDLQVLTRGAFIRPSNYVVRTEVKKASDKKFTRYIEINDLTVEYSPTFVFKGDVKDQDEEPDEVDLVPSRTGVQISPTPPTSAQPHISPEEASASPEKKDTTKSLRSLKHRRDEEDEEDARDSKIMPPPPLPAPRQMRPPPSSAGGARPQVKPHPGFKFNTQPLPVTASQDAVTPDITPLGKLISTPVGRRVNVLVIVSWVGDRIIARNIGNKRDMNILDSTSDRPTRLSVWLDLDKFIPKVGDVVLFRGLYVHKFDGRSLNAFPELEGTNWYEADPDVEGAEELEGWYRAKVEENS